MVVCVSRIDFNRLWQTAFHVSREWEELCQSTSKYKPFFCIWSVFEMASVKQNYTRPKRVIIQASISKPVRVPLRGIGTRRRQKFQPNCLFNIQRELRNLRFFAISACLDPNMPRVRSEWSALVIPLRVSR